jgi:hypothetical protein
MPVEARHFIRKMRGGAQAHLVEAGDGNCYIVKFQNNPQHPRILINELIACELLRHLQIAAPDFSLVRVTPEFLTVNPAVHLQTGSQRIAPLPGWHFGSRHPGHPNTTAVYDVIPDSMFPQVANLEQFRAVLVFDRWVANADGRQSIFLRAQLNDWLARPGIPPRKMGFVALMIDHGFIFNGPHWDLPQSAITGLYARRHVYSEVRSLDDFEPWLSRVENFPAEVIDRALRQVPSEWLRDEEDKLLKLLERVVLRQKRIREIMLECLEAPGTPFPRWAGSR